VIIFVVRLSPCPEASGVEGNILGNRSLKPQKSPDPSGAAIPNALNFNILS